MRVNAAAAVLQACTHVRDQSLASGTQDDYNLQLLVVQGEAELDIHSTHVEGVCNQLLLLQGSAERDISSIHGDWPTDAWDQLFLTQTLRTWLYCLETG